MNDRLLLVCASLVLGACGAIAPTAQTVSPTLRAERSFHEADVDSDAELTADELHAATVFFHREFDSDGNATLDRAELSTGMFRAFDVNGSGRLDPSELERGAMTWWPAEAAAQLERIDGDGDGYVDPNELGEGAATAGIFAHYDRDGDAALTDREVTLALFESWDLDASRSIDAFEWRLD